MNLLDVLGELYEYFVVDVTWIAQGKNSYLISKFIIRLYYMYPTLYDIILVIRINNRSLIQNNSNIETANLVRSIISRI